MATVSFCTPVIRPNACLMNAVESYLSFGEHYVQIFGGIAVERESNRTWVKTTIKILSMVLTLGLLPLLALAIKAISYCCHEGVIVHVSREMNPVFYERVEQSIALFDLLNCLIDRVYSRAAAIEAGDSTLPFVDGQLAQNVRDNPIYWQITERALDSEERRIFERLGREYFDKYEQYERDFPFFERLFDSYLDLPEAEEGGDSEPLATAPDEGNDEVHFVFH